MILYTAREGKYYSLKQFKKDLSNLWEDGFNGNIYVNLTNRCNCACTFCLRSTKEMDEENTLWIKEEPDAETVIAEFEKYDWSHVNEVVFCGFGEPTLALPVLLEVMKYCKEKHPDIPIRLNTNGLANLQYERNITPELQGLVDTVSISLNASNAEKYLAITKSSLGEASYEGMLKFASSCKDYIPHVVLTIVDCIGEEEIQACRKVCEEWDLTLRIRPFET